MTADKPPTFVLSLSCPDRIGIVHAVAGTLAEHGYNILESKQFDDRLSGRFFMRVEAEQLLSDRGDVRPALAELAARFEMEWDWHDVSEQPSLLLLVSRFGHCLHDLLYRQSVGSLRVRIPAIVSNHTDFEPLAKAHGIDFHHLPITPATKLAQEKEMLELVDSYQIDLVVLARYMQILSPETTHRLAGRIINIHHGLLPSFKGARPYLQAHERGVKVIGATAHYVTDVLDEGPIIEQVVQSVDHAMTPEDLAVVGRDIECQALSRAVTWHVERRVLLNGNKTVVFA